MSKSSSRFSSAGSPWVNCARITSLSATAMRRHCTLLLTDTCCGLNRATTGSPISGQMVSLARVIGPAPRDVPRSAGHAARPTPRARARAGGAPGRRPRRRRGGGRGRGGRRGRSRGRQPLDRGACAVRRRRGRRPAGRRGPSRAGERRAACLPRERSAPGSCRRRPGAGIRTRARGVGCGQPCASRVGPDGGRPGPRPHDRPRRERRRIVRAPAHPDPCRERRGHGPPHRVHARARLRRSAQSGDLGSPVGADTVPRWVPVALRPSVPVAGSCTVRTREPAAVPGDGRGHLQSARPGGGRRRPAGAAAPPRRAWIRRRERPARPAAADLPAGQAGDGRRRPAVRPRAGGRPDGRRGAAPPPRPRATGPARPAGGTRARVARLSTTGPGLGGWAGTAPDGGRAGAAAARGRRPRPTAGRAAPRGRSQVPPRGRHDHAAAAGPGDALVREFEGLEGDERRRRPSAPVRSRRRGRRGGSPTAAPAHRRRRAA